MSKKIVTLSDTSHPFTSYVDEPDETDNTDRTLTTREFDAIRAFQSDWGYSDNYNIGDELTDMLADTTTRTETLIVRFMDEWFPNEASYDDVQQDLRNLFILRATVMSDSSYAIPTFDPDEVKALESLPGEKSDETLRKELFKEESDKRVIRYFIGQSGWVWFIHIIVDMPEKYDGTLPNTLYRAKDGMTTLHMTHLFMSEEKAWNYLNEDIRYNTQYDDDVLTHVVELDKL